MSEEPKPPISAELLDAFYQAALRSAGKPETAVGVCPDCGKSFRLSSTGDNDICDCMWDRLVQSQGKESNDIHSR